MPPREDEIDYACEHCGFIRKGPHAGETAPGAPDRIPAQYKGAQVSHSGRLDCPHCKAESEAEYEKMMIARHGPNFRKDAVRRQAEIQAEKAKTNGAYWKSMFGKRPKPKR